MNETALVLQVQIDDMRIHILQLQRAEESRIVI